MMLKAMIGLNLQALKYQILSLGLETPLIEQLDLQIFLNMITLANSRYLASSVGSFLVLQPAGSNFSSPSNVPLFSSCLLPMGHHLII